MQPPMESRRQEMRPLATGAFVLVLALFLPIPVFSQFGPSGFTWSPAGPYGTPARLSAIAAYQSSTNYLAASPEGGLWQSIDGGNSWQVLTDAAPSSQICSVIFNPANPTTLFAGTGDDLSLRGNPGVMRSVDGGQTWSLSSGFSTNAICALAQDPANSVRLVAGSLSGIFLSVDQGKTWKQVSAAATQTLLFDPSGNGVVYATVVSSTFMQGAGALVPPLLKSTDGGVTWNPVPITPPYPSYDGESRTFQRATMTFGDPGTLYLAVSYLQTPTLASVDVYVSPDGGNTWNVQQSAFSLTPNVAGLGRLPMYYDSTGKFLYIGGSTVMRSTAAAQAFAAVTYPSVGNLRALSSNLTATPPVLLAAGDQGLASIPLASGSTAAAINNPPVSLLESISVDPVTTGAVYNSGEAGVSVYVPFFGVWKTLVAAPVGFTTAVNTNPESVYAMASGNLYRSTNGGTTFTSVTVIPATEQHAPYPPLIVSALAPNTLYTAGGRLYRSANAGLTWAASSGQIDSSGVVTALASSPLLTQVMFAATACLTTVVPAPASCPATSHIYFSANTGATWIQIATVNGYVSRLAVDPNVPTAVYAAIGAFPGGPNAGAGLSGGDLVVIRTNGTLASTTTTSVKGNLPSVPFNAILVPGTGGTGIIGTTLALTYYAGTDTGVYYTTNGGANWVALSTGLPPVPVTDLALQGTTLRAATYGRGAYTANISQASTATVIQPLSASTSVQQGQSVSIPLTISNKGTAPINFQLQINDSWLSVSTAAGQLAAGISQNVVLTVNASALAVGNYRTQFQLIQLASTANPYAFVQNVAVSVQVTNPPASLVAVSGGGVTVNAGSQVTLVTLAADTNGVPILGAGVQFHIVSGGGQLSSSSVTTNALGQASVTLTMPSQPGVVTVTATSGTLSAGFTITGIVLPTPTLNAGAVVNAATFVAGGNLAPGAIVSLFGSQLAAGLFSAASLPLPTTLGGTQVFLGATAMPLLYVSPTQINAILPFSTPMGSNLITVNYPGPSGVIASNAVSVNVAAAAPGIFNDGAGGGIFVQSGKPVSTANPAARGSLVTFFATGLGAVSPSVADGAAAQPAPNLSLVSAQPTVNIGGVDTTVQFAGLAPGFAGLYQINALVPASISADDSTPLTLRVGLMVSNTVTLAVK
jgi:uncharacterized protein (TIGR03437 family)